MGHVTEAKARAKGQSDSAVGLAFDHAVLKDGTIQCWGYNSRSQLGNPSVSSSTVPTVPIPVMVTGVSDAIAVATGRFHTCAVLSSGIVQCWGNNDAGQLGTGDTITATAAATVSDITNAVDIEVGDYDSCALLRSGMVQCWGDDSSGQLGNGISTGISAVPVTVSGL